MIKVAI